MSEAIFAPSRALFCAELRRWKMLLSVLKFTFLAAHKASNVCSFGPLRTESGLSLSLTPRFSGLIRRREQPIRFSGSGFLFCALFRRRRRT